MVIIVYLYRRAFRFHVGLAAGEQPVGDGEGGGGGEWRAEAEPEVLGFLGLGVPALGRRGCGAMLPLCDGGAMLPGGAGEDGRVVVVIVGLCLDGALLERAGQHGVGGLLRDADPNDVVLPEHQQQRDEPEHHQLCNSQFAAIDQSINYQYAMHMGDERRWISSSPVLTFSRASTMAFFFR